MKRVAWQIASRITNKGFSKEYAELRKEPMYESYLIRLLRHAHDNAPYYTEILGRAGVVNSKEVNLSRFSEIPMLTKEIIRKHFDRLVSKDYTHRKRYYNSSGGSTGEPTRFIQDSLYDKWGNATSYYYYKDILGIELDSCKKVILWGSERDLFTGSMGWKARFANWVTNTLPLNSFVMMKESMQRYVETINSYKPDLIRGYASSLYELCNYVQKEKLRIHTPKVVISSAEKLTNEMRTRLEEVFGTKVYDFYGSRETSNIAGECREGPMHIFSFNNYVEILDNQNLPVCEGQEGRVVITSLHNYSMPFIRYEIGDMAVQGPSKCTCGNPLPTLRKITGRVTNHFIREDGALVSGAALTLTFNLKDWVKNFRIIQEDYSKVRILIVPEGDVIEYDQRDIENKLRFIMGQDCQVFWEFVDEIPRTPQGKYLYTQSLISKHGKRNN